MRGRGDRLAGGLSGRELDGMLVMQLVNVSYLTGFGGTNGSAAAPPCRLQGKYDFGGEVTQYPHVRER